MGFDFSGKRILVTGAGRGIGRALAVALHKSGAHVYAVSRTKSTLTTLQEECPGITTLVLDVSNFQEMVPIFEGFEPMDGVVNNAATFHSSSALQANKEEFDTTMNTYVWAAVIISQIFARKMISAKIKGSIVNVSSILSKQVMTGYFLHSISKSALDMTSKQFALELAPHDIRVNSVNPSLVMTEAIDELIQSGYDPRATTLRRTPRGRLATVDEIVQPILYLLSDYSSAVTGTTHDVDCGSLSVYG